MQRRFALQLINRLRHAVATEKGAVTWSGTCCCSNSARDSTQSQTSMRGLHMIRGCCKRVRSARTIVRLPVPGVVSPYISVQVVGLRLTNAVMMMLKPAHLSNSSNSDSNSNSKNHQCTIKVGSDLAYSTGGLMVLDACSHSTHTDSTPLALNASPYPLLS